MRGDLLGYFASTRVARWNKVVFLVNKGVLFGYAVRVSSTPVPSESQIIIMGIVRMGWVLSGLYCTYVLYVCPLGPLVRALLLLFFFSFRFLLMKKIPKLLFFARRANGRPLPAE